MILTQFLVNMQLVLYSILEVHPFIAKSTSGCKASDRPSYTKGGSIRTISRLTCILSSVTKFLKLYLKKKGLAQNEFVLTNWSTSIAIRNF